MSDRRLQNQVEGESLLGKSSSFSQQPVGFFHPTKWFFKYTVLLLIALICFGSYFSYDEIENFEDDINDRLDGNPFMFQTLYAVYSFPNIVLVFFGGALADKIGLRMASIIFMCAVVVGTFFVAFGMAIAGNLVSPIVGYVIVLGGRLVFGMGAETLNVIQTSMITLWFKEGKELAFAMGLVLSASRLGDYVSIAASTAISDLFGSFLYTLWTGVLLCVLSLLATLLYCVMDKYAETKVKRPDITGENDFNLKVVKDFDVRFWIISFLCMTYYSGVLPFIAISSDYLQDEYGCSEHAAGLYTSSVILSAMVLSPVLGKVIDLVGHRPYFVILGSALIIPSHLMLYFTWTKFISPIVPIIGIGLSFSIVPSTLWPSVPIITRAAETSTAFGMMTAIQNGGLTLTNLASGQISNYSKRDAMLFFVAMDCVGFLLGWLLIVVDKKKGALLCRVNPINIHEASFVPSINDSVEREGEEDYN